ncbi:MAG: histidinol-phosphate transaminase [Bacteroidetes bacterium]|nr:histidinol-phosphate transaminase [Bacteroidota bacterium]
MEIEKLARENIRKLKPYSSARSEFSGRAEIFLDANENPYPSGLNRYPDPLQRTLKKKISALKGVAEENIFLGNGSDEVIDLLIRIFCEPIKDHIITLPPTYGMYQVSAGIAGVEVRKIPLTPDFQVDVPLILNMANNFSKLLFLCSPNNPTGNSLEKESIQYLAKYFKGILVIDEAYIDFSKQGSCIELLRDFPNIVVMQTFSKAWGLAGIRLGMAFASKPIIDFLNKVKPPYNINQLTQNAALEALGNIKEVQKRKEEILVERKILRQKLTAFLFVQHIYPSDANFLLVKVETPDALYDFLIQKKIIVRNRSKVLLCEGCLRITVGTPEENEKMLKALASYQV